MDVIISQPIYLFVSRPLHGEVLGEQYDKENKKMICRVRIILSFNFLSKTLWGVLSSGSTLDIPLPSFLFNTPPFFSEGYFDLNIELTDIVYEKLRW